MKEWRKGGKRYEVAIRSFADISLLISQIRNYMQRD